MGAALAEFAKDDYPNEQGRPVRDVHRARHATWLRRRGLVAMITMQSWMFLSTFEKLRAAILAQRTLVEPCCTLARGAFDTIRRSESSTIVRSSERAGADAATASSSCVSTSCDRTRRQDPRRCVRQCDVRVHGTRRRRRRLLERSRSADRLLAVERDCAALFASCAARRRSCAAAAGPRDRRQRHGSCATGGRCPAVGSASASTADRRRSEPARGGSPTTRAATSAGGTATTSTSSTGRATARDRIARRADAKSRRAESRATTSGRRHLVERQLGAARRSVLSDGFHLRRRRASHASRATSDVAHARAWRFCNSSSASSCSRLHVSDDRLRSRARSRSCRSDPSRLRATSDARARTASSIARTDWDSQETSWDFADRRSRRSARGSPPRPSTSLQRA